MKARLTYLLLQVRESFWFIPTLMVVTAFALAHGALGADRETSVGAVAGRLWFGALDESSSRVVLSTVTGAMITTASLVFSLTLVALTLASQQLGPRLLSMFLRDRITQTVLGLFLATFVYALIVLMALGGDDGPVLVPMLSITIAVVSTIASFVALIMFIHHLSTSLQADVVVSRVAAQLKTQIQDHLPVDDARNDDGGTRGDAGIEGRSIPTTGSGYIQAIDDDSLLALAGECDLQIRILHRPGHFLCEGEVIAEVSPRERDPEDYAARLRQAIVFGEKRTSTQDLEFGLMAIVEIALRALSPGINDPHTAVTCVDRLGEALVMLFHRPPARAARREADGRLRLVRDVVTVDGLLDTAFNEIRQYAADSIAVTVRLAETFERLARCARTDVQRAAVRRHCEMLARASAGVSEPDDRRSVDDALERARRVLDADARG